MSCVKCIEKDKEITRLSGACSDHFEMIQDRIDVTEGLKRRAKENRHLIDVLLKALRKIAEQNDQAFFKSEALTAVNKAIAIAEGKE